MPPHPLRTALGAATVAVLAVALTLQSTSGGLTARLRNSTVTTGSGTLLYTHSYGSNTCSSVPSGQITTTSSFTCSGTLAPSSATPASGSASATDSIQYRGTATASQVTQSVSASACGVVALADSGTSTTNPLLSRYGTTFNPATGPRTAMGSITLDGAGGSETSTVAQTPATSVGLFATSTYGYGIWFGAVSGSAGGTLFGAGSSPGNNTGTNDRVLSLTSAGRLMFTVNTAGATVNSPATKDYRDGNWHFAYVTQTLSRALGVGATTIATSLYVDGNQTAVASSSGVAVSSSYSGYWHLGFSPSVGGYFAGSLSSFLVFSDGAPAAPTVANLASSSSFDSWSSSATDRWRLNDTGLSVFTGTYPGNAANPCTAVNVSWGFTNPVSCAYTPTSTTSSCTGTGSLSALANGTARTIASPVPGNTQVGTLSLSRGTGYDTAFDPGLRLLVPLTFTAKSGAWVNTFTWSDQTSVFLA